MWPLKKADKKQAKKPQKRGAAQTQSLKRRRLFSVFISRAPLAILCVGLIGGAFMWQSGLLSDWMDQGGQKIDRELVAAGFGVDEIDIIGEQHTPVDLVLETLAVNKGQSMATLDLKNMRRRLEALQWVKAVTISRILPNSLKVDIIEHQAAGLWQEQGHLWLIDQQGAKITDQNVAAFGHLPLVVGAGANHALSDLLHMKAAHPALFDRIKSAVWVGERRWDLHFKDGVLVKMPEKQRAVAWLRLSQYEKDHKILSREVLVVDMRLPGKTVLRLTEQELKARKTLKSLSDKTSGEKTI